MPFDHVIIDLAQKPAEFLQLSPTGLVPLLQLQDGTLVTESIPVSRKVATSFAGQQLRPPRDAATIENFINLWTERVEPAYYEILRAASEPQARFATVGYLGALSAVEEALFSSASRTTG